VQRQLCQTRKLGGGIVVVTRPRGGFKVVCEQQQQQLSTQSVRRLVGLATFIWTYIRTYSVIMGCLRFALAVFLLLLADQALAAGKQHQCVDDE